MNQHFRQIALTCGAIFTLVLAVSVGESVSDETRIIGTAPTQDEPLIIKAGALWCHMTIGHEVMKSTKADVVLEIGYSFHASPDQELGEKGLVKITDGEFPMEVNLTKGAASSLACSPGAKFTAPAGTVIGRRKVESGMFVSVLRADKEGYTVQTFEGTTIGTEVIDLESNRRWRFTASENFELADGD